MTAIDTDLALPTPLGRGRQTDERRARYEEAVRRWCAGILKIWRGLDFEIGTREWCYLLEPHRLAKDDFDKAERLLVECRKKGLLPLDIVIEDDKRAPACLERLDQTTPEEEAESWVDYIKRAHLSYMPISFWENQDCYVEIAVEKASLRSLFEPRCELYHVPIYNGKGWGDLHCRAAVLRRFAHWQGKGKRCVLLYCGDHDPHGLRMSSALHSNLCDMENALAMEPKKRASCVF
jgi:hypothetical protein